MMQWILARLGFAVVDLDAVAKAMAGKVIADYDPIFLDPQSTIQFFRTKYMRMVIEFGLPAEACNDVADRAWRIVAAARGVPATVPQAFALYD